MDIFRSSRLKNHAWTRTSVLLPFLITLLFIPSCKGDEDVVPDPTYPSTEETILGTPGLKCFSDGKTVYWGPETFIRIKGAPVWESCLIENQNSGCFDRNFILKIHNGFGKKTRVASAEIRIDGKQVVVPSDFSKNVTVITKHITDLLPESVLEVKLNSTPGAFIVIWIEGVLIENTPVFTQIGPLDQNSFAPELPDTSNNGISGTWDPATINTATAGNYSFVFTPDSGQCALSAEMAIEVINKGKVTDIEGTTYNTILIGNQWWMAENLRTILYNNGDLIATTSPATLDISGESEPKYQWAFDGMEDLVYTYGRYYTWYTTMDSRGICPAGWHVPSDADWNALAGYLINNGYGYEGSGIDIAKSLASGSSWISSGIPGAVGNDPESNNITGFSALPGGNRTIDGRFLNMGSNASWWTSTETTTSDVWFRNLRYNLTILRKGNNYNKKLGVNIRCIKDK